MNENPKKKVVPRGKMETKADYNKEGVQKGFDTIIRDLMNTLKTTSDEFYIMLESVYSDRTALLDLLIQTYNIVQDKNLTYFKKSKMILELLAPHMEKIRDHAEIIPDVMKNIDKYQQFGEAQSVVGEILQKMHKSAKVITLTPEGFKEAHGIVSGMGIENDDSNTDNN